MDFREELKIKFEKNQKELNKKLDLVKKLKDSEKQVGTVQILISVNKYLTDLLEEESNFTIK